MTIVEDGLMAQCNQKSSNYKVWSHAAVVGIFATHVHCNRCSLIHESRITPSSLIVKVVLRNKEINKTSLMVITQ